jgi:TonB family protein
MRFWIALVATALIPVVAFAADSAPAQIRLSMAWDVSLDAQGHVTQLSPLPNQRADRVPQIREKIDGAIRGWQFVPGAIDGAPAPTQTRLSLTVELIEKGNDAYRIVVDDARTGGRMLKLVPPKYPAAAVRAHKTGMVVLRVNYDAGGKVTSASVEDDSPQTSDLLAKAAIEASATWTFSPEQVGDHGVAGTSVVPVCFNLSDVSSRPTQRDMPTCEWMPPGHHTAIGEGDSLAIHPVAHLQSEVIGRTL